MSIRSLHRIALGWIVVAACCAVAPALAAPPDSWITTRVKMALLTNTDAPALPVNVDTFDGVVTLHGKVETESERDAAVEVARGIEGVREVRNLLQVVPDAHRKAVKSSDDRIRAEVEQALHRDSRLRDARIHITSVNDGVVLLSGKAHSMSDHLRALQTAARVPGVRRVASEIESPDRLAENWDDEGRVTRNPGGARSTEVEASDSWTTARTKMKLMADPEIPAGDINVDTENGRVTLFGLVPTKEARSKAERLTRQTSGVRSVTNQLRVVPPSEQKMVKRMDHELQEAITDRIDVLDLDGEHVQVEVRDGIARLTGTVQRPADRFQVLTIARGTEGVRAVNDQMRVEAEPSARYY